jgi:NAD(P)-dependent dehydrogenase (short-subunit alcohol dehydrogenase family)
MGKLDGKVGLITGESSGIGLATAQEFVKEGAFVSVIGFRAAAAAVGGNWRRSVPHPSRRCRVRSPTPAAA